MTTYFLWFVSSLVFGTIGAWLFARMGRSRLLGFAIGFGLNVLTFAVWQYYSGKKGGVK